MTLSKSRNRNFYIEMLPVSACVIIFILFFSMALAKEVKASDQDTRYDDVEFKGRYSNANYLFSFSIPEGFICLGNPAPNPNHGCGIRLSENPKRYIWTDGSYNAVDEPSISSWLDWLIEHRQEKGSELSILERKPCLLGGIDAERAVFTYKSKDQKEAVIEDVVVSFRTVEGYGEIVYTVGLISSASHYKNDKTLIEQIISSWTNDPPQEEK